MPYSQALEDSLCLYAAERSMRVAQRDPQAEALDCMKIASAQEGVSFDPFLDPISAKLF